MTVRKGILSSLAFSPALLLASAHAEWGKEWQAYAEEVKADCAKFEESLPPDQGVIPKFAEQPEVRPLGWPMRPYVCIYLRFRINADGAPEDIDTVFKAPGDVAYSKIRAVRMSVKKWRFKIPETHPDGFANIYAKIVYDPPAPRTYDVTLDLRNGGF
jgi:hypothetical protein